MFEDCWMACRGFFNASQHDSTNMISEAPKNLIRPLVRDLHAYVPGEQPKIKGLIKLNTNENPYPASARVLEAVKEAVDGRLRLYPNPTAQGLREKLAKLHGCAPENIIVGNGSDELLALATRAFVEPLERGQLARELRSGEASKHAGKLPALRPQEGVQYFTPSYSLYPVLADIHGVAKNVVPPKPDFSMPRVAELKKGNRKPPKGGTPTRWKFDAALTFITTPNAP